MPEDAELPLHLLLTSILRLLFISKSGIIQPMGLFKRSERTPIVFTQGRDQDVAPLTPEAVREEEFVRDVNVIHGPDGRPTHFIPGRTLRPDNLGRIRLIEEMGSPTTKHWVYRTTDGVYHIDSEMFIPNGDNQKGKWVLRQRAYKAVDGTSEYRMYEMDTPRQKAFGQSIRATDVLHSEIRELPHNSNLTTLLESAHAQPWDDAENPGLWDGLSCKDQARMSVVDDALSIATETQGRAVGAFAAAGASTY